MNTLKSLMEARSRAASIIRAHDPGKAEVLGRVRIQPPHFTCLTRACRNMDSVLRLDWARVGTVPNTPEANAVLAVQVLSLCVTAVLAGRDPTPLLTLY